MDAKATISLPPWYQVGTPLTTSNGELPPVNDSGEMDPPRPQAPSVGLCKGHRMCAQQRSA